MRILMFGAGMPPPTFIQRQIQALESLDVTVELFPAFKRFGRINAWLLQRGCTWHLSLQKRRMLAQADILHFQWPNTLISFFPMARALGKPLVLSLRGQQINVWPRLSTYELFTHQLREVLPYCAGYHCVSADIQRKAETLGLDVRRAQVIYTAVDAGLFSPPEQITAAPPVQIIMVGALIWRKAYEYALLAIEQLVKAGHDIRCVIVGEGADREHLEYTLNDLRLDQHVQFAGQMPFDVVRQMLWVSHIFLHTALSEGIANVVIEAMACGLPVVTTDVGGMSEAVTHGVEGYLVPPRDPAAIADALSKLIQDVTLRRQMGQAGRERVLRQFTIEKQAQSFVGFYQQVINSRIGSSGFGG